MLRALAVAAAALFPVAGAGASPAAAKDPDYLAKSAAFKRAVHGMPEAQRQPTTLPNENFLTAQQWGARAAETEAETAAAVQAVRAFAAVQDVRVVEELVRTLGAYARAAAAAQTALDEATQKYEQVSIPFFQEREDEFRRTGSWPTTVLVSRQKSLDTLNWQQREAAHAFDFAVRIRDAASEGIGTNLVLLGADRGEAWKAAVRMGTEGKDPAERAAFCEAVRALAPADVDETLLAIEAREKDVLVVCSALEALGQRRTPAGFQRLVRRLDDPEPAVVAAAVRGVARYRSPEVVPALVARLRTAHGRIFSDVIETLFGITGKHLPDEASSWEGWWKKEGEAFLKRWSPDVDARLDEVETIGLTDERLIDVPAELAALLPTETDQKVRDAILDNLSIHKSDFARVTLIRALNDASRTTRIAAIRGLGQYRHVSVPEELMRVVPRADAEELQALFQSLRTLWGGPQEFAVDGPDREKLIRWWETTKGRVEEQFKKLGSRDIASGRKPPAADEARWRDRNFYGLRVDSDRMLFVVDVSLSMEEPARKAKGGTATGDPETPAGKALRKIDVAKNELARVLRGLPDGTQFGLVFFSITVQVWDQGMVVMGPDNRKKALAWVDALKTHEATNIYDALESAFLIGTPKSALKACAQPDTIFLVSDGAPTAGKFLQPDVIREYVRRWNKGRNVKIHVVGVGEDHDVVFCRNLAEENGGYYIAK
jgi:HEAT repeat protein